MILQDLRQAFSVQVPVFRVVMDYGKAMHGDWLSQRDFVFSGTIHRTEN